MLAHNDPYFNYFQNIMFMLMGVENLNGIFDRLVMRFDKEQMHFITIFILMILSHTISKFSYFIKFLNTKISRYFSWANFLLWVLWLGKILACDHFYLLLNMAHVHGNPT